MPQKMPLSTRQSAKPAPCVPYLRLALDKKGPRAGCDRISTIEQHQNMLGGYHCLLAQPKNNPASAKIRRHLEQNTVAFNEKNMMAVHFMRDARYNDMIEASQFDFEETRARPLYDCASRFYDWSLHKTGSTIPATIKRRASDSGRMAV
jgi:hypothetical protein